MTSKLIEESEVQRSLEKHPVESTVVLHLPDKIAYPLTRPEFDILCEGPQASNDERLRDAASHTSVGAFLALIGLVTFHLGFPQASREWLVLACMVLTATMFLSALVIALYLDRRIKRHKTDSAYSRLTERIYESYKETRKSIN